MRGDNPHKDGPQTTIDEVGTHDHAKKFFHTMWNLATYTTHILERVENKVMWS